MSSTVALLCQRTHPDTFTPVVGAHPRYKQQRAELELELEKQKQNAGTLTRLTQDRVRRSLAYFVLCHICRGPQGVQDGHP